MLEGELTAAEISKIIARLPKTERAISQLRPETQELFAEVLPTEEFRRGVKGLGEFLKQKPSRELLWESRRRFAGFLFENLAYFFVRQNIASDEVVLSPGETIEFLHTIHPDKPVIKFGFGFNQAIDGLPTPDGFILVGDKEETSVVNVCEYTFVSRKFNNLGIDRKRRLRSFETEEALKSIFGVEPEVLQKCGQFLHSHFGLPRSFQGNLNRFRGLVLVRSQARGSRGLSANERRKFYDVPMFMEDFFKVVDGLYEDVKDTA